MKQKMLKKKTVLDKMTKDELAKHLYSLASQKNLVIKAVSKFKNHPQLSLVLDFDGCSSELNLTIASVIDRINRYSQPLYNPYKKKSMEYKMYDKGFKQYQNETIESFVNESQKEAFMLGKEHGIIWNDQLRLEKAEDIEGYFTSAYFNNILKVYKDYQTDKRKCEKMIFFEDYAKDNSENKRSQNKMMSYLATNPEKQKNFNSTLVEIAKYLKTEDAKINNISIKQNKSQLAKLFLAIVNEKKNFNNEELRENFDWSPYLLRKNKEDLIEKVRSKFEDRKEEIIQYLDDREVIGK